MFWTRIKEAGFLMALCASLVRAGVPFLRYEHVIDVLAGYIIGVAVGKLLAKLSPTSRLIRKANKLTHRNLQRKLKRQINDQTNN